jgi:peptide/nickel transport system substrate-binding protein
MDFDVRLWKRAEGAYFALMPNLNAIDPVWRDLNRDLRYRRALSVAINRKDVNKVIFFGLAKESGNTALPESPLYSAENADMWMEQDKALANRLLDEIGLTKRDERRRAPAAGWKRGSNSPSRPPARAPRRPTSST